MTAVRYPTLLPTVCCDSGSRRQYWRKSESLPKCLKGHLRGYAIPALETVHWAWAGERRSQGGVEAPNIGVARGGVRAPLAAGGSC